LLPSNWNAEFSTYGAAFNVANGNAAA
jgi:hypothetical protein